MPMADHPRQFDKEGLLQCARGELFGPGNAAACPSRRC